MNKKPNLLLIWTDQQRPETMKCYGNDIVRAPNLDRLADASYVFRNPYCAQPVCTPSRGTINTGLWPHSHGAWTNNLPLHKEAATVAEMISDDYETAYFGKWHLGDEIFAQHGFDKWVSIEDYYRSHYSQDAMRDERSSYHHFLVENGYAPDSDDFDGERVFSRDFAAAMGQPYTKATFLGKEVSRHLRERESDSPFFLNVNFLEPHPPLFGPLNNRYDPDDLELSESFNNPPGEDIQYKARMRAEQFRTEGFKTFPLNKDWDWKRLKANYYGLVEMVDAAVGEILQALEESGEAENTVVAFTSDHGELLTDHRMMKKGVFYEGAARVPWLIKVPWMSREQTMIEGRASLIDLVPTLLDLIGEPVGDHLPGRSLVPVLKGEETLEDNTIFIQWNERVSPQYEGRAIITPDGWKLCLMCEDNSMLFDLTNDPLETKNLFNDPAYLPRIRDLRERLVTWQQSIEDKLELPEV
jgi:arylsulfatase A-like enzyme